MTSYNNGYKISWQSLENWLTGYRKANFHFGSSSTVGQTIGLDLVIGLLSTRRRRRQITLYHKIFIEKYCIAKKLDHLACNAIQGLKQTLI